MSTETESVTPTSSTTPRLPKLALALAKAQGQMANAAKDTKNPFFNSKYADLASVWDACRKPLSDNELCVVQLPVGADAQHVAIETQLHHSSGESITSVVIVPITATGKDGKPVAVNAQHVGSAMTYARRYGLSAMVGIAPEDDDGNSASGRETTPLHLQSPRQQPQQRSAPTSAAPARDTNGNVQADYGADGAPISERAKLEVAVADAQNVAGLDALVERAGKLAAADKASFRKLWTARREVLQAEAKKAEVPDPDPTNGDDADLGNPAEMGA